ncbi:MAG: hypothetical protein GX046_06135 [Tissierellia bacterium]|nr:hypothetical protein [Tissierellia bacterium]
MANHTEHSMTKEKGSYTIELSVLILAILFVFMLFFSLTGAALQGLYLPGKQAIDYEEAFLKKAEELRHEKVLREER